MSSSSKSTPATVIAISGGSGSGKTTLARELADELGSQAAILYQDWYYRDQSAHFDHDGGKVNFDHPDALEFELLAQHLSLLKAGQNIEVPQYDFSTHRRLQQAEPFPWRPVIIIDGILILHATDLRPWLDVSVFVEAPEGVRFQRRLARDVAERGRTPEGVKAQFKSQVKPMHDQFVEPSKKHADHLISGEESFAKMIVLLKNHLGLLP